MTLTCMPLQKALALFNQSIITTSSNLDFITGKDYIYSDTLSGFLLKVILIIYIGFNPISDDQYLYLVIGSDRWRLI